MGFVFSRTLSPTFIFRFYMYAILSLHRQRYKISIKFDEGEPNMWVRQVLRVGVEKMPAERWNSLIRNNSLIDLVECGPIAYHQHHHQRMHVFFTYRQDCPTELGNFCKEIRMNGAQLNHYDVLKNLPKNGKIESEITKKKRVCHFSGFLRRSLSPVCWFSRGSWFLPKIIE